MGELLHSMGILYFCQNDIINGYIAKACGVRAERQISETIGSGDGTGSGNGTGSGSVETPIDDLVEYWKWVEDTYGIDISAAIAEHGKAGKELLELYGDELAEAIEKVGGADDVIRLIAEYSDSAEDILKAIATYGDDVVELITEYGDEAVDLFKAGMSADKVKEVLGNGRISYDKFKELNKVEQAEVFSQMSSKEIYELVKNSPDSWTVEAYDLITPDNAKDFIKITNNSFGETAFNLNWPKYGGYEPNTISSIGDLSGKVTVSRDGGDGGYTMGIGKNPDGTYANNSQRAIPKSSAEVNTGTFDVDLYKSTVDIVVAEGSDFSKINKLVDIGIDEEIAEDLLSDYKTWLTRPEIIGDDNISDGLLLVEKNVDSKYGYYGNAAEWNVGDVKMSGGAGQMNTVYSWGTLKEAGIITDIGKAIIN